MNKFTEEKLEHAIIELLGDVGIHYAINEVLK